MDNKVIEQIINQSIKRLKDEYELLNATMLNALHQNIDILMNNADKWFGGNIPEEYRGVLNSLMTVAYLYFQEKGDVASSALEPHYEEFRPDVFINSVISDMEAVLRLKNVRVDLPMTDSTIRTSRKILRDSLYNIFLSIAQFMNDGSSTRIELRDESSRMRLLLEFESLNNYLPDVSKLSKVFYSYFDGFEYHINVGINVALENLRNIGVIVKVTSDEGAGSLKFNLTIPTTHFLETVEEIRSEHAVQKQASRGEEIGLCFEDIIVDMVIRETLAENGYSPFRVGIGDLRDGTATCRKLVTDYDSLARAMAGDDDIREMAGRLERFVIIYGDKDPVPDTETPGISYIKKPFDVDEVTSKLK